MVETLVRSVVAACQPVGGIAAQIVGGVAVFETIGEDKIDHFVGQRARAIILACVGIVREHGASKQERAGRDHGSEGFHQAVFLISAAGSLRGMQ